MVSAEMVAVISWGEARGGSLVSDFGISSAMQDG